MINALLLAVIILFTPATLRAEEGPLSVVATFSILGDVAKQVGGDLVQINTLVGPDGDAHSYHPTPADSLALAKADLIIQNGLGFEGWLSRMVSASGYKGRVVTASDGVVPLGPEAHGKESHHHKATHKHHHTHGAIDPHAWQDVSNMRIYAKNIALALVAARPHKEQEVTRRHKTYDEKLALLDKWIRAEIAAVPADKRRIITSHDAFGYYGRAYGVRLFSVQGVSTEAEPSAKHLAALVSHIKKEKVGHLFLENMANPKLVQQLARDSGATVGTPVYSDVLSKDGGEAPTYLDMMRVNTTRFTEAMRIELARD